MSRSRMLLATALGLIVLAGGVQRPAAASAQEPALVALYGDGVHAYFAGDFAKAQRQLTRAIDAGSRDPRAFFFRGLVLLRQGDRAGARSDFDRGARLEHSDADQFFDVSRALERVQGRTRLEIERYRAEARVAAHEELQRARFERYHRTRRVQDDVSYPSSGPRPTAPSDGRPVLPRDDRGAPAELPDRRDGRPVTREEMPPADSEPDDPFADPAGEEMPDDAEPDDPFSVPPAAADDPFSDPAGEEMPDDAEPDDPFSVPPAAADDPFADPAGEEMPDAEPDDPFGDPPPEDDVPLAADPFDIPSDDSDALGEMPADEPSFEDTPPGDDPFADLEADETMVDDEPSDEPADVPVDPFADIPLDSDVAGDADEADDEAEPAEEMPADDDPFADDPFADGPADDQPAEDEEPLDDELADEASGDEESDDDEPEDD